METITARAEILQKLLPLYDGSTGQENFYQTIQQCLSFPLARDVLVSFNIHRLLALKSTSRVSISGTKYHMEKSSDERMTERDERQQLAQCLDQLLMPGVKMASTIRQIRQFTQALFDGFLNADIAPRIIHSALPKALYDVEVLSSSAKAASLVDKFGLFYLVCDLCYLALSLHNIAPGAGSPEYVFCHELAKVTLSILSNMARADGVFVAHIVKAHGLTELFGATLKKGQVSQQLLNQLCLLLRLLFKPTSPPFRIELIDALIHARLEIRSVPNGSVKNARLEALSNTLWVATALPAVASHVIQNFDFLKIISDTIKLGPDEHSESHTGILANCLAQKHIDPGLLKPVIQTILKLLKSTQSVSNCLRIIALIAQTPRGAEILLQEKTDLYLRVLIQQQTNQERVKCAQDICRRLGEFNHQSQNQTHETGFAWGKVHHKTEVYETKQQQQQQQPQQLRQSIQYEDNDEQPIDWSRIDQNGGSKPGYYEPTNAKKLMPRPKTQQQQQFKVNQQWAKYKPDSDAVHVEMDEENEEKPNNYSVEDTPGMTPREQSPVNESKKEIRGKSPSGVKSGYTSGIQSGARTPAIYQATPLMYSRQSTPESIDVPEIDLSRLSESEHGSAQMSGQISPSEIPDSPGQLALERHKQQQMQQRSDETRAMESSKPLFPTTTAAPPPPPPSQPQQQQSQQPPVVTQANTQAPNTAQPPPFGSQQPLFNQPYRAFAPPQQPSQFSFQMTTQPISNQPYYQPFTGGFDDDDDDGPVQFAEEGSMSPRSHAQLSEMTIDSTKHDTIDEEKKCSDQKSDRTNGSSEQREDSFFMHKDDTNRDETIVDNSQKPHQEDDIDLLDDLMNTGLDSITQANDKPKSTQTQKRVPKLSSMGPNQPGEAENFFESLEKKMAEGEPKSTELSSSSSQQQQHVFKVPETKKDSPLVMSESAKYCSELMNSDSIKPYNSEGTPNAGGSEHTTLSNITIDSELSTAQKKMEALNLNNRNIHPVPELMNSQVGMVNNIPDGQSDSSAPTTAAAAAQVIAPSQAPPPPPQIEPSSRGEPKVFNQIEDTPIKDYSRPDSELSSLSFHSSSSEVDLEQLANIGLPPQKPLDPHPHQIIAAESPFHSPYHRPPEMSTRSPRARKAESLPEAAHHRYGRSHNHFGHHGSSGVAKSEMGDNLSRIPIANITHRPTKSRKRADQSSGDGKRSRSSASSRQSKNQDRQKSSVQKVFPPVTSKPKSHNPITSTPHTPTRGYSQFDGLQGKPSTPKTPKSPKGRINPIGSIKKLLNGDSSSKGASSSDRKKSSSNSLNADHRNNII